MKKRLCIIAAQTDFSTDPRIYKQALSALEDGWEVTCAFYHNFDKFSDTVEEGCRIIRIPFSHFFGYTAIPPVLANVVISNRLTKSLINTKSLKQAVNSYMWSGAIYGLVPIHFFIELCRLKIEADVYHATDMLTLLTGVMMKGVTRKPLVYDSHEMWVESIDEYSPNMKKLLTVYERHLIRKADAVTTVNNPIAEELSRRYNIKKPTVVMNTPHLQDIPNNKPHDAIRIMYQGRYARGRGLEVAVDGVNKVTGTTLYMRGIDAYGKHEPYVAELKARNPDTVFLPPVDMRELVSSLDEYDIGIVPYQGINFNNLNASPNKTFEYMMAGMAVLVSDLPVLSEIVKRCKCGRTYKQDDPEDLAKVLREMIPHLDEMKHNARRCAEAEYNWKNQGKKLIDLYNRLIK